jgi:hypothetical protein
VTTETGTKFAGHQIVIKTIDPHLTDVAHADDAVTHAPSLQPCLRDNECSQQQLVRLVGYRGPVADLSAWDRQRRLQAALQGVS